MVITYNRIQSTQCRTYANINDSIERTRRVNKHIELRINLFNIMCIRRSK